MEKMCFIITFRMNYFSWAGNSGVNCVRKYFCAVLSNKKKTTSRKIIITLESLNSFYL